METTNTLTTQEQHDDLAGVDDRPTRSTPFESAEHAAIAYAKAGLSVIPLNADKSPAITTWKQFQTRIATEDEIQEWYRQGAKGVGIICGSISGNLECLDDDEKYNIDSVSLLDQLFPIVEAQAPGLLSRLVHETSINHGHHFVYRCNTELKTTKLAMRPLTEEEKLESIREKKEAMKSLGKTDEQVENANVKPEKALTLIETRSEGAYFACYPMPGYQLVSGSFTAIPEISSEERNILLGCARTLHRFTEEDKAENGYPKKRNVSIVRPGDDYNGRGNMQEVLENHGWTLVYVTKDRIEHWRRPGKRTGISATFNKAPGMFYVFSSNCSPLEPNTWYTKFALYAQLEHNGSYDHAAMDLAEQGYGETTIAEAETFLNRYYEFRFNEVTGRNEYGEKGTTDFRVVEEYDLNSLSRKLLLSHINMGPERLANLLKSEFSTPFDPFKEYYENLPAWDRTTDYIAQLADTVMLKHPHERQTWQEYLKKWLVAAVGCAIDPKINNQTCMTLVGPQGYYKTTWLNRLVPSELSRYVHVGTIDPANKDTMIHLSECLLINLDELESLNKHELGTLKSIMTMSENRIRRPYGHFADTLIRRASFVGSINRDSFLADETGSRRFLVFEIDTINAAHGIDMDNVHAQAYSLLKSGFRYWFDTNETSAVNQRNKAYSVQTTEDELVNKYCSTGCSAEWKTATDVAQRMSSEYNYSLRPSSARDFGRALKKAEYPSKKVGGYVYYAVSFIQSSSVFPMLPTLGGVTGGVKGGVNEGQTGESELF